ncbi:MAG: ABC transporter ATP-binding protein [Beijerinckiaceae bacterium]
MVAPAAIQLDHVAKRFGDATVVNDISFSVSEGSFLALLGPSGCGKSTTLRMIAGLEPVSAGRISIAGRDVTDEPPARRGLSMVFQNYALFPHLDVRENIIFGLRVRKETKAEIDRRLSMACDLLGLGPYLDRKPSQLSGGQQQRVALGRAIVAEAPVCLMDEPLSNLDAKLRAEMRREIRSLQQRLGMTMIYVTHDQIEAMTMADRIILMNAGRIEHDGTPEELYATPRTMFSARFIGTPPMNVIPAPVLAPLFQMRGQPETSLDGFHIGIRPEQIRVAEQGVTATLQSAEYLGADTLLDVRIAGQPVLVRHPGKFTGMIGQPLYLAAEPTEFHWFDSQSSHHITRE